MSKWRISTVKKIENVLSIAQIKTTFKPVKCEGLNIFIVCVKYFRTGKISASYQCCLSVQNVCLFFFLSPLFLKYFAHVFVLK